MEASQPRPLVAPPIAQRLDQPIFAQYEGSYVCQTKENPILNEPASRVLISFIEFRLDTGGATIKMGTSGLNSVLF